MRMHAVNQYHESSASSPQQTLDMVDQFGIGRKGEKDTGAGMVHRELQVQTTNPQARAGYGKAQEHKPQNLRARNVNVFARSGNQRPDEVMSSGTPYEFIWGGVGQGEDPHDIPAPPRPGIGSTIALGAAALGVIWLIFKDDNTPR